MENKLITNLFELETKFVEIADLCKETARLLMRERKAEHLVAVAEEVEETEMDERTRLLMASVIGWMVEWALLDDYDIDAIYGLMCALDGAFDFAISERAGHGP